MPIGTTPLDCYQEEDVQWSFTVTDPNISDITGWVIQLVVKASEAALDPALLGPVTCSIVGSAPTLTFKAAFKIAVLPGIYVYSARRTDAGHSWQLAQAALTVRDSASIDT